MLPEGSSLEGFLLPQPPGKDYRLLKVVTQPATGEQLARLGNDRVPVVRPGDGPLGAVPPPEPQPPAKSSKSQDAQLEFGGFDWHPAG